MANGSVCKIIGFGIVKIKMFDGVVHDLGGVAYVPNLRRNLISISQLVDTGCRVDTTQGGDYEITHDRIVLMKG